MSDHIDEFFQIYILPYTKESETHKQRDEIRESLYLNKLLYDNNNSLRLIYELYKDEESGYFTLKSANLIFMVLEDPEIELTRVQLRE